jgi:hypothetical protein
MRVMIEGANRAVVLVALGHMCVNADSDVAVSLPYSLAEPPITILQTRIRRRARFDGDADAVVYPSAKKHSM